MVCIGFINSYSYDDIRCFFKKYNIICLKRIKENSDKIFIEVETEALRKNGFCAFGDDLHFHFLKERFEKTTNVLKKQIIKNNIERIESDITLWYECICSFVSCFEECLVWRYYEEVEYDNGMIEKSREQLTKEDLLKLDVNQILFIHQ